MDQIALFLQAVKFARKQSHSNLTLFPLLAPGNGEPYYLLLDTALDRGSVEVTEVSKGGEVPELKLINRSAQPVLMIEGEELVGAKQNRIVNASFLLAAESEVIVPVSCVEQGRWAYQSREFRSGHKMMHASLRSAHQSEVIACRRLGGGFESDQGMIWRELAEKAGRMKVSSPTAAMADMYEQKEDQLSAYVRSFHLIDNQVGAIFLLDGKVAGLDCFGYQDTFARFFQKLVKSYALDALDWFEEGRIFKPRPEPARRFLDGIRNAKIEAFPSIGVGENLSVHGRTLSGSAFVHNEKLLHLSAFKSAAQGKGRGVRVPSHRFYARYGQ